MPADMVTRAIQAGSSPADFRLAILERQAAEDERNPIHGIDTSQNMRVTRDEGDTRRQAMTDAIVCRLQESAGERPTVPDAARGYMALTLSEMAATIVGHRGQLLARNTESMLQRAFHSTSDFPNIFGNAINVRLLQRYQLAPAAYRRFFAQYNSPDFRPVNAIRAGDFPAPQPILENGEIKGGTFSESKEQFQVLPFGVTFNISRQMIINDNLNALNQLLGSAGDRVANWENGIAFALLLSGAGNNGPTLLTDTLQVFQTATHGNLAAAGTVIDVANVGLARAAMRKQKSLDGLFLNVAPSILLCGPDKETQAEQLLTSITPAQNSNAVPDSIRTSLTVVADANISGNPWYLFADPQTVPTFVYGFLEGFNGPRLSTQDQWSVQGMSVKLEHDFGVAAIDFRGAYRNPGA
jgi:hypothetical protein